MLGGDTCYAETSWTVMKEYLLHRVVRERDIWAETFRYLERVFQVRKYLINVNPSVLRQEEGSTMGSECIRVAGVTWRKYKARMETLGQIIECSRAWKGFGFYSEWYEKPLESSEQSRDMINIACWDLSPAKLSCLSASLEEVQDLGWQVPREDRAVLSSIIELVDSRI